MDRSIDNYLHKKFKKQLSIDTKAAQVHQQNDKENKDSSRIVESSEEKTSSGDHRSSPIKDNNKSNVPNQSTNNQNHDGLMPVVSACELSKSSISSESGNSKPCISNTAASQDEENRCRSVSFDTFRPSETTKFTISSSSKLTNVNEYQHHNPNHPSKGREITPPPLEEHFPKEEYDTGKSDQYKPEEAQPTPEKNPSGKYVCNYCNLVCSKPSVLQKHIRAHTNERPYPCTSCGFSFKTRSNLYKHCRSRTHANRLMGVKAQENTGEIDVKQNYTDNATQTQNYSANEDAFLDGSSSRNKPYKPRFHQVQQFVTGPAEDDRAYTETDLSHHINEIINKNNSIVNSNDPSLLKRRFNESLVDSVNNNECSPRFSHSETPYNPTYNNMEPKSDEPLNLTNKNRKRCMSEIAEPVIQKSLIKELLLKNLYSDMQCPYCKMIFQTVTELELHKLRSCKGKPSEAKYTRSSSVNVASILTKNKNAFDNIPQFHNSAFPLNSPGPFLGKTRLVEGDKGKSFSFDAVNLPVASPSETSPSYVLSPLPFKEEKKAHIKLFGGEVKIHNGSGESKSYRIDSKDDQRHPDSNFADFDGKLSENRLVKSSLQSGGTVLTNKTSKEEPRVFRDIIRVYENTSVSPNIDMISLGKPHFSYDANRMEDVSSNFEQTPANRSSSRAEPLGADLLSPSQKYPNISDFSQNAIKLLTPNIKHPTVHISGMMPHHSLMYTGSINDSNVSSTSHMTIPKMSSKVVSNSNISVDYESDAPSPFQPIKRGVIQKPIEQSNNIFNPMNLLVNGKVIRYVPGMPGPVTAEVPFDAPYGSNIVAVGRASRESPAPIVALGKTPFTEIINSISSSVVVQKAITPIVEKITIQSVSKPENQETNSTIAGARIAETASPVKIVDQQRSPEKIKPLHSEPSSEPKKFIRPNSLALKPTTAALKQHHGLTPTIFNQILISPDTPRVAKKYAQHLFNGNYFSYLGLKCSTKPVYCTLNKTQPFYVPHFKKLSMYSEWRQQDTKVDKFYVSAYDSRQRNQRYTTAGRTVANLIIHSSYKFVVSEVPNKNEKDEEHQKPDLIGGYECNEDSPYIRGRGRGRYVCEQCGIRCKKPSMLKKHIRTHSNDRPYTCNHCNFSFKTKGNLTKHMKSKSHTKNYTATSSGSGSSTQLSVSQSSESDTDDSGMDSSDESMTRLQEHEAAYGLLSLSQKTSVAASSTEILSPSGIIRTESPASSADQFMTTEEIAYVSKTNYAKNKILDNLNYKPNKQIADNICSSPPNEEKSEQHESLTPYLGKTSTTRPLTYPYTSVLGVHENVQSPIPEEPKTSPSVTTSEPKSIKQFHVIQKYTKGSGDREEQSNDYQERTERNDSATTYLPSPVPTLKVNDVVVQDTSMDRKRKINVIENNFKSKMYKNDEVMDLSITANEKRDYTSAAARIPVDRQYVYEHHRLNEDGYSIARTADYRLSPDYPVNEERRTTEERLNYRNLEMNRKLSDQQGASVLLLNPHNHDANYNNQDVDMHSNSSTETRQMEYDNSAMETLADVATKQVRLDKNTLAKSVASEYLKLATQNEHLDNSRDAGNNFIPKKDVMNDLIVKPEGSKSCTICSKSFNKPFQLRLHMNIHYLERPFRCDSCSVSFRTKGHLQKHERSASHYSKLSSSPAQSSSEPRPFKCSDCNIAFRIHGHLAKHLRSKMHIMKLECLSKIPFGLYAELERSNSLLTEINTSDGDQCLESLKTLAKKVFINDPGKLQTLISEVEPGSNVDPDS